MLNRRTFLGEMALGLCGAVLLKAEIIKEPNILADLIDLFKQPLKIAVLENVSKKWIILPVKTISTRNKLLVHMKDYNATRAIHFTKGKCLNADNKIIKEFVLNIHAISGDIVKFTYTLNINGI